MQELSERISEALAKEEARAERFANNVRLILFIVLTTVALLNALSVSLEANIMNFGALTIGYIYGFIVFIRIRRLGYNPMMKYITSCLDIVLVFLLLFLYTRIEIPSVALKNYVFLIVFPLIALTAFRYDQKLTFVAGGLAVALYLVLVLYLYLSNFITITNGGYERELFSDEVTYIGQLTKVFILSGYVILLSYLAQYSRILFAKLVSDELSVRNQKELTDWELKIASQVQDQFLPHSFPEVSGLEIYGAVQQGRFVGGDYYDFIKLADDELFIVVADVSGKGVPAALIMAEVRASTHLLVSQQIDLEDFAQQLNSLVHQSTDKRRFVTFYAAKINTSKQILTYVNAGHPPPLICSEGKVRLLAKGTIALGLCASLPQLTKHTEKFPPGCVLVSYTDGLSEQTNPEGEQYGEERLREYVRTKVHLDAQPFTRKLFEEIKNFGAGKDLNDDVGLIVVKYYASSST
jgi:serine phosphatase RsbU (regulator of sigma subunit)